MARREREERTEELSEEERIRRSVGRTVANWILSLLSLAVIGGWCATGFYKLEPGEAGVILRFGEKYQTVTTPGPKWHLPPPIEYLQKVNVTAVRREEFGLRAAHSTPTAESGSAELDGEGESPAEDQGGTSFENAIQTADSNIVNLGYVLQYRIKDAFSYLYGIAHPRRTLYDATQAAVREVVGRRSVDEVLWGERDEIQRESELILQQTLDAYFAGIQEESAFEIDAIQLQVVQPPAQVQQAFNDVVAAQQDEARAISEARGDAQEILEKANAEAAELEQQALAYKEAKILEAGGEARRFEAILVEYQRAPDVTRRRLYLETMEKVLPGVEKMLIESDAVNAVPFLPVPVTRSREGTP